MRSNGLIDTECPHYRPIANWLGLSNNVPPEIWFKCIQQKLVSLETGKISPVDTSALENAMFRLSPSGTLLRAPVGIFHKQQYILQQLANARNQLERIQAKISELDAKRSEFLSIG